MTPGGNYSQKLIGKSIVALLYLGVVLLLPAVAIVTNAAWRELNMLSMTGRGLVVAAFSMLALQPVLAARLRLLDHLFGLDIVYVFHKTMGMTAGTLLLCGLVFLGVGAGWSMHVAGIAASGLVIILLLTALLYRELGMSYESWRVLHNALALAALTSSFVETLLLTAGAAPALVLLVLLYLAGITAYTHHRLIGPARRRRRLYRVESVRREARNVWTLALEPPEGTGPFDYLPGQFQFLTFDGGRGEEHPFTISSSPTLPGVHTATIKESGDFTRTIGAVRPGDRVAVQAPFGRFSYVLHPDEKDLVFIAGGIGITPLMSMIRHMRDTNADRDVLLLYANNAEDDIVFREELDAAAAGAAPRLRVVHVLSKAGDAWQGDRGFINKALIEKYCRGGIANKTFYLCGPPPMMTAIITLLMDLGVPSGRIRSERFAL